MFFFEPDRMGRAFGLLVALLMLLVCAVSKLPLAQMITRSVVGFVVGYAAGFIFVFLVSSSIRRTMAADRVSRSSRERQEREAAGQQEEQEAQT